MRGFYRYREGKGAYAGMGLYGTNEPGLGFIVALYVPVIRFYFRYIWGSSTASYWGRWFAWKRFVFSVRRYT